MHLADLDAPDVCFQPYAAMCADLEAACAAHPDLATCDIIGTSEGGRPLLGITLGFGPQVVTLCAGAHADEPVGPVTLRTLVVEGLAARGWEADGGGLADLFDRFTFRIVPHVNPDAEALNQAWIGRWPDLPAYLVHRLREPPGRDVEFGYPAMRPENAAVSRFLFDGTPIALHASLHGMGFSEGALLLIEKRWADDPRTGPLRAGFVEAARAAGLPLHDHDRGTEKGFRYLGPGFWTTPEGAAMRAHFQALGDAATAALFHASSMEQAVATGKDPRTGQPPLCLVTELPLWVLPQQSGQPPGVPSATLAWQAALPALTAQAREGRPLDLPTMPRPLDLATAVWLQRTALDLGLAAVGH